MKKGNGERNNEEAKERWVREEHVCVGAARWGGGADEETETGVIKHTVARVVAGWTGFLLGCLPALFHPGKDLLGQGRVRGQGGGRRRCGWGYRGGRSGWLIRAWLRGGPSTATRLLSPAITISGIGGQWRGHLGAGVVLRRQAGPHAAAIQLLGLG